MPHSTLPRLLRHFCVLACIWSGVLCFATPAFPEDIKSIHPTGYVTDLAGVVQQDTKAGLEALCTELEQKTSAQMAVVTVHSLEGQSVEEYANNLFKQLGVGHKDNRGVMLLVAPDEHKYWTEVGYGLEPVINDARAGDAGRLMVPFLKRGDYSRGIAAGARQLAQYIADDRGVTLSWQAPLDQVPPIERSRDEGTPSRLWIFIVVVVLLLSFLGRGSGWLGFLLGLMMNSSGRRSNSDWGGGGWGGGGDSGGFGGFGGGSSGGGGAGGSW